MESLEQQIQITFTRTGWIILWSCRWEFDRLIVCGHRELVSLLIRLQWTAFASAFSVPSWFPFGETVLPPCSSWARVNYHLSLCFPNLNSHLAAPASSHLRGCRVQWYLIGVLIFISLMINDSKHLFVFVLAIRVSSPEKYLFKLSVHFWIELNFGEVLWLLSYRSSLYIVDINLFSNI